MRRFSRHPAISAEHDPKFGIITDFIVEGAFDGRAVAGLMKAGAHIITRDQMMDGTAGMIHDIQVEATFPHGTKLVTRTNRYGRSSDA